MNFYIISQKAGIGPSEFVWLGITDEDDEGHFFNLDGSPVRVDRSPWMRGRFSTSVVVRYRYTTPFYSAWPRWIKRRGISVSSDCEYIPVNVHMVLICFVLLCLNHYLSTFVWHILCVSDLVLARIPLTDALREKHNCVSKISLFLPLYFNDLLAYPL